MSSAFLFLSLLCLTLQAPLCVPATERWTVALDRAYAPHEYWENGTAKGFNTDIVRSIARIMNREIQWIPLSWSEVYEALTNGTVDSVCMARSPERELLFDFSQPIMNITLRVFVRDEVAGILSIEDLAGHTVAVEAGDICEEVIQDLCPEAVRVPVESQEEAIRLVVEGEVTAAFCNMHAGGHAILKNSYSNVKMVAQPIPAGERCIAVRKGNVGLLTEIDRALDEMKATGEYDQIMVRWFGEYPYGGDPNLRTMLTVVTNVTVIVFATLVAVVTWSWSLRRRVKKAASRLSLLGDLFRHDLRNIEQCISACIELLTDERIPEDLRRDLRDDAIFAVNRAKRLIDDYSTIEELTANSVPLTELDLGSTLSSAVEQFATERQQFMVRTRFNHVSALRVVAVPMLKDVFLRILESLASMPTSRNKSDMIDITTSRSGRWVMIEFRRHCNSIPENIKEGLLKRHMGVQAPMVGLDMSMVYAAVTSSRGVVRLEDIEDGGVLVRVCLRETRNRRRILPIASTRRSLREQEAPCAKT